MLEFVNSPIKVHELAISAMTLHVDVPDIQEQACRLLNVIASCEGAWLGPHVTHG